MLIGMLCAVFVGCKLSAMEFIAKLRTHYAFNDGNSNITELYLMSCSVNHLRIIS